MKPAGTLLAVLDEKFAFIEHFPRGGHFDLSYVLNRSHAESFAESV